MQARRNWAMVVAGLVAGLAGACTGVKYPNSGWQDGRRTCGDDCPGRLVQVRRFGGPAADAGRAIVALSGGDLLLAGSVWGPATWSAPAGDRTLCPAAGRAAFLARVDEHGEVAWASCSTEADAYGLALAPDGGSVVVGEFENTAVFAAGTPAAASVTAAGRYDMFVARYDEDGALQWVRTAGGDGRTHAAALAALPDGGVAVCGAFGRHATFGAGESNELAIDSDSGTGLLVARYDASGALAWARGLPAGPTDEGSALVALADGSLVVAGHFSGSVMFDTVALAAEGTADAFLARLDPTGTVVWAERAGGSGSDSADGLALMPDGTLLVAGHFEQSAAFGPGTPAEQRLSSAGDADVFLARYDADGNLLAVLQEGGRGWDAGFAVTSDPDGGAVLVGSFEQTATFGAGEPMQTVLTAAGDKDLFVARFDADGRLAWATMAGGPTYDEARGALVTSDGVVLTGSYGSAATFGAGEKSEAHVESISDPQFSQDPSMVSDGFLGWLGP